MIMWLIILAAVVIAFGSGIAYLVTRIRKFGFFHKMLKKHEKLQRLLPLGIIAALILILTIAMNLVNAVVCIIHLCVIWLLCDLCGLIVKKLRKKDPKRYIPGVCAVVLTLGWMSFGWYEAHHVNATHYTIETEKNCKPFRIVQFADSHIGAIFDGEEFEKLIGRMNDENPDIAVITGDFVDDGTSREELSSACAALGKLRTRYGVYYCYGNHDKGYNNAELRGWTADDLKAELLKNNVIILEDEAVILENGYSIIGRRDASNEKMGSGRKSMKQLTEDLSAESFTVVLDHQPNDYAAQSAAGVDLVLSGHTHGGQFFPVTELGWLIGANDMTYGYEKRGNTNFIVTSGLADWELQFKTGCISEYNVIDITH